MTDLIQHMVRSWRAQTLLQLSQLLMISVTGLVVLVFLFIQTNLRSWLDQWGSQVELTVFLRDEISLDERAKVEDFLKSTKLVRSVEYVDKAMAAKSFSEAMGHAEAAALDDPKLGNPLPASFNARLVDTAEAGPGLFSLESHAKDLVKFSGVEDVVYGQGWIENYRRALRAFDWTTGFVFVCLAIGIVLLMHLSGASQIARRREEIAILEIVGATPWQISRPFIFEAMALALVGWLLAIGTYWVLGTMFLRSLEWHLGSAIGGTDFFAPVPMAHLVLLGLLMVGISCASSLAALKRMADGWSARSLGSKP